MGPRQQLAHHFLGNLWATPLTENSWQCGALRKTQADGVLGDFQLRFGKGISADSSNFNCQAVH